MARAKNVTRTFSVTNATVLCLNCTTAEPFNETVKLSGVFEDEKQILKAAKKLLESDEISVAKVVDVSVENHLYAMPEQVFLKYAVELPLRK